MRRSWVATGVTLLVSIAIVSQFWLEARPQPSGLDAIRHEYPLLARGLMEAPAGTAVLGADPAGGAVLTELRVEEGNEVKKGDMIAVLSNYANADYACRRSESDIQRQELQRTAMISGYRNTQITMQGLVVQTARDSYKLKKLEMDHSPLSPDLKTLNVDISQRAVEREELKLRIMKESLASEIEQLDLTLVTTRAALESARSTRELALIRSPLDGVVVQIFSRPGERISPNGIVKIADLHQLRVFADVNDAVIHLISVGSRVEIVVRGQPIIYTGKVSRIASTVERMQRVNPDGGSSTDARAIQVEIEFDHTDRVPRALGREVQVSFLPN